jgi:conjugative relaxase-like TrwC/TraI family protein
VPGTQEWFEPVLRLAKLTDAEYVLRQVAGGLEDYYLGSGEAPGVWSGCLAGQLGLAGVVEADMLRQLIDRRHPASGDALGEGKQPTVRAIDATFSAPKSASLLWAFAGPEAASVVSICHVEAVEAALGFVESNAAVTRRQVGGTRVRARASGWAAATFVHRTSRAGDPQIHTHAVIPNVVQREDGQWVAIDATAFYRWARAAGCVYQEELRRRLSERLGVAWGPDRNGCREMVGISEGQLRGFSKRTVQIEEHLAAGGTTTADARARMRADEAASVATRPAKDPHLTPEHLRGRWEAEAAAVSLPVGEALLRTVQEGVPPAWGISRRDVGELFDRLVDPEVGLCSHDSRFGEAQVVEAVAAWGAGRLGVGDINGLTCRFLRSDRVVRLFNADSSGRAAGQWSTIEHRRLEDRVLEELVALQLRRAAGVESAMVDACLADAPHLGGDQAEAVRRLCAAGPAIRALISPAGYGKTTTLSAATEAARKAGRPILALSTTNQAVDQLRQAGIEAMTVARFARSGAQLASGSVVVVDEFSQLPTREAHTVLDAARACPDSLVWMVGDPLQAQPVAAGGLAHWIAGQARQDRVPVAELRVNRRQADPVERQALGHFRAGQITESQDVRDRAGWEQHHPDRDQALSAMAASVLADIERYGADRVAALAVNHADCEALADRIRAELVDRDLIRGPSLRGPGWAGPRDYQAGDRILLHAHAYLDNGSRLANGVVATVRAVSPVGLTLMTAAQPHPVLLPAEFVTSRTADGRPQLSHAWARTIDGVQGGTWDQVHLLATPALDRYRGYVGQSRSISPTHTWNTTPRQIDDHGGKLVEPYATPAEQIAAALARAQPKTFAADDDPHRHQAAVRVEQRAHQAQLACRPADMTGDLKLAEKAIRARQRDLDDARDRLAYWQTEYERTTGLHGLTRAGRDQHRTAGSQVDFQTGAVERQAKRLEEAGRQRDDLIRQHAAGEVFDRSNQWRAVRVNDLDTDLNLYWTQAVLDAARDGHPAAYGKQRLLAARHTLIEQIEHLSQRPTPSQQEEPANRIADPLMALRDLDRAIKEAVEEPVLHLVEPVRPHRYQPFPEPGLDVRRQHRAYRQLDHAGPSIGIEL